MTAAAVRACVVAAVMLLGCDKADTGDKATVKPKAADTGAKKAEPTAGTVKDGVRRISIEANADGYTPDRIAGKPGEKVVLVFTRTIDADCISKLKAPDGTTVDLPKGKPVDVAVTVPAQGEIGFACGMDMFHGVVVADPKS